MTNRYRSQRRPPVNVPIGIRSNRAFCFFDQCVRAKAGSFLTSVTL